MPDPAHRISIQRQGGSLEALPTFRVTCSCLQFAKTAPSRAEARQWRDYHLRRVEAGKKSLTEAPGRRIIDP